MPRITDRFGVLLWPLFPCAVLLMLCLGTAFPALGQTGSYDWTAQPPAYPGVKLAKVRVETPRPMDICCLRVDLTTPGLRLIGSRRAPDWEVNVRETRRETTRNFMNRWRQQGVPVVAAVNANFFAPWPAPWNEETPANLLGLAVTDGDIVSPAETGLYSLVVYTDNTAAVLATGPATPTDTIRTAVSGYRCLNAGSPDPSGPELHPRTGAGVSQDGTIVYLLVIDGRRHASQGATIQEVGAWLKHFGAWNGINLDGGGSTTMARWVAGLHYAELVSNPVGSGVNWLEFPPIVEQTTYEPTERCNGNNLGVVVPHLDVLSAPGDITLDEFACHTLEVTVTSASGPVTCTWFRNGQPIPGDPAQTTLELCPVTTDLAGVYECEISDNIMTIRTPPARISVTPRLPVDPAWGQLILMVITFLGLQALRKKSAVRAVKF